MSQYLKTSNNVLGDLDEVFCQHNQWRHECPLCATPMDKAKAEHEGDGFVIIRDGDEVCSLAKRVSHDTYRVICLRTIGDAVIAGNNGAMHWTWNAIRNTYGPDAYDMLVQTCQTCGDVTLYTRDDGTCEYCEGITPDTAPDPAPAADPWMVCSVCSSEVRASELHAIGCDVCQPAPAPAGICRDCGSDDFSVGESGLCRTCTLHARNGFNGEVNDHLRLGSDVNEHASVSAHAAPVRGTYRFGGILSITALALALTLTPAAASPADCADNGTTGEGFPQVICEDGTEYHLDMDGRMNANGIYDYCPGVVWVPMS